VFPLLTKADGTKYGKSASGAVYLDPKRTSPYRFYQFFIQSEDADVVKLLKVLTFLSREEIERLAEESQANPGARAAQKALARELTTLVHGAAAYEDAKRATEIMFGGALEGITEELFRDVVGEIPTLSVERNLFDGIGASLTDLVVHAKLATSKGQARKDIESGGIYLNNVRCPDTARVVLSSELLFGKHLLLRKGKRNYVVLSVS
jgi:tyrosyl-tRNA synthetase